MIIDIGGFLLWAGQGHEEKGEREKEDYRENEGSNLLSKVGVVWVFGAHDFFFVFGAVFVRGLIHWRRSLYTYREINTRL